MTQRQRDSYLFALFVAGFFILFGHLPRSYSDDASPIHGRIVDSAGSPVVGASVFAVHLRQTNVRLFKFDGVGPNYDAVIHSDRFVSGEDGRYEGKLPYLDGSRTHWSGDYVYYFACMKGYHPLRVYLPERDIIVMRRSEQPDYGSGGIWALDTGWARAEKAVSCAM